VHYAEHQPQRRTATEGPLTSGGEREDRAQAEHIARLADEQAARLLRRHEPGRPDEHPRLGQPAPFHRPRDPEVDDARPVGRQQHVRRLQVPVHQPGLVDRLQSLGEASRERAHRVRVQRAVLLHRVGEGRSRHVRRGHPRRLAFGIGVDNGRGEYAAHVPGGGHLARETVAESPVFGKFRPDHLDGDDPPPGRPSDVDPPHAAGPEPPEEPVRPHLHRVCGLQVLDHVGPLFSVA
jgi:hypothetical protein